MPGKPPIHNTGVSDFSSDGMSQAFGVVGRVILVPAGSLNLGSYFPSDAIYYFLMRLSLPPFKVITFPILILITRVTTLISTFHLDYTLYHIFPR